ncbi:hypothetical protein LBMAG27_22640 [Bacteroidota bacterium]|nr:hypothetical protein LBMAG27_22640 [Bacteroidota bacterium]
MEQELQDSFEWIITITALESVNKRKAITFCEQIINRYGRLLNYKKQKITQLKFTCELAIENIASFLKELQKYFSVENYLSPENKKIVDSKKASLNHIVILILTVGD